MNSPALIFFPQTSLSHNIPVYLVLWHEEILGSLLHSKSALSKKARSVLRTLEPPDKTKCYVDKTSKLDKPYDKDWLKKAQSKMLDFEKSYLASQLVGALYNLCKEFKDIFDEDAVAYAKAYKDAMVRNF